MRRLFWVLGCLVLGSLNTGGLEAQAVTVVEFQVNSYTTNSQAAAAVAVDSDGAFVVVWESYGSADTDQDEGSIQGQRYASDGVALGGEFQVNSLIANYQVDPAVAMNDGGDFVVVWETFVFDRGAADSASIQGQRYGSDGSALGGEFQVNTYTTNYQATAAVAMAADGDFVVVWRSVGSAGTDSSIFSIQGQRYASDGSALGGEFQVNTYTTSSQSRPEVAVEPDGDFVVVWQSIGSAGTDQDPQSVQGQRYASDGSALGGEFQVNVYTTSNQRSPTVAVDADGDFVVVWESIGSAGTDQDQYSVQGQRYASDGSALGGEFQVNTYTTSSQSKPEVAVEPDGEFVVVWQSRGSGSTDQDYDSVQGQRYASDGSALGGEFQVNVYTTSNQRFPAVAVEPGGDFVVVWHSFGSFGSDTDGYSIQGQLFSPPFFSDGFESGDTSAWE